jgi:hypothetical protein
MSAGTKMDFWVSNFSSYLTMNLVSFLPLLAVNGFAIIYATIQYSKCKKAAQLIYLGCLFNLSQIFLSWATMQLATRSTPIRPFSQFLYYLQAFPSWVAYGLLIAAALASRSQVGHYTNSANQDNLRQDSQ